MLHWLSQNVLPYALHAAAATVSSAIVLGVIVQPFKGVLQKFHRAIDSLDPETDTGVTRQLRLIHKTQTIEPVRAARYGKSA